MGALGRVLLWLQLCGKRGARPGGAPHAPEGLGSPGAGGGSWRGSLALGRGGPRPESPPHPGSALPSGAGRRFARCAVSPVPGHSSDCAQECAGSAA